MPGAGHDVEPSGWVARRDVCDLRGSALTADLNGDCRVDIGDFCSVCGAMDAVWQSVYPDWCRSNGGIDGERIELT